jgi:4-amino-4-deoxy-L-arabinose transferase-like glycosyltransferase
MSHKSEVKNNPDSESFGAFSIRNLKNNKFPIIITIFFFLALCFVSLTYHTVWHESDGIVFLNVGQQILDGENAITTDAQPGGSVFYAFLNSFIQDGFFTTKIISLLSGSGIVFLTYFIVRNFCDKKVALTAQLLTAVLVPLTTLSILAFNELLMLFLITCSMYFITKNQLRHLDILLVGIALGLAFMIRYQPIIILIAFIIFLLIRNKKLHVNILSVIFLITIFLIASSPVLVYNSLTYGDALNANTAHYMIGAAIYTTPEWKSGLAEIHLENGSMYDVFLLDPDLFLKNYFHTLLNKVPDRLFNFDSWPSFSIVPIFQYIGIIPVIGGLLYLQKIKLNKITIGLLFVASTFTIFLIALFGEFHTHFFAIIAVPLLVISILNLKYFKKNFWPLLILLIIFPIVLSIVPFQRTYQLLPMWIPLIVFNAVFFLEVIPKIYEKFLSSKKNNFPKSAQRATKIIIILLIVINLGVSVRSIDFWIYEQDKEENHSDFLNEFMNIIKRGELTEVGHEQKLIGNILAKQVGIEDSLVMSSSHTITYYANSNHLFAAFNEGVKNDPLEKYFTRENWSLKDLDESNLFSNPSNMDKMKNTMPDYVVYYPFPKMNPDDPDIYEKTQAADLWILNDPKNPNIPSNFEVIYKSDKSQFIVYKINN